MVIDRHVLDPEAKAVLAAEVAQVELAGLAGLAVQADSEALVEGLTSGESS